MTGFLKAAVALTAVAAGTVWALNKFAPEVMDKAKDAIRKAMPIQPEADACADADACGEVVEGTEAPAADETAADEAAAGQPATAEDWPDLSQIPGDEKPKAE